MRRVGGFINLLKTITSFLITVNGATYCRCNKLLVLVFVFHKESCKYQDPFYFEILTYTLINI